MNEDKMVGCGLMLLSAALCFLALALVFVTGTMFFSAI